MSRQLLSCCLALMALACARENEATGQDRPVSSAEYLRMAFHEGPPNWSEIEQQVTGWSSVAGARFTRRPRGGSVEELWFRARLPDDLGERTALYVHGNLPDFEAFVETSLVYRHTGQGRNRQGYSWFIIPLPSGASGKTMYIRTFDVGSSVDIEDVSVGALAESFTLEQQVKEPLRRDAAWIVFGLFYSLVGYVVIVISLYLPKSSRRVALAFGVMGALYGLRILVNVHFTRLVYDAPPLIWYTINDFLTYLMPVPSLFFFEQIIGRGWKSIIRRLWQISLVYAVVAMAVDLWVGVPGTAMAPNGPLVILSQVVLMAHIFRPGQGKTRDVRMLRLGFAFFVSFILLNNLGVLSGNAEAVGVLVFLFCFGDVVLYRVLSDQKRLLGIRQELETARSIQANILPETMPRTAGLDIAVRYVPMAEVAGDFYDFLPLDEKRLGILIADVSGHGVPAALIASMVKVAFSAQEGRAKQASRVLSDMNRIFCGKMKGQFVTAGYIYIDAHEQKMTYSTAGHPPLLIWRRSGRKVQEIRLNGMLMGHIPDAHYEDAEIDIESGDRVVLYTDGIVEATNSDGEFFGKERLVGLMETRSGLSAEAFADHLLSQLSSWTGRTLGGEAFEDDLTFVVADIKEV